MILMFDVLENVDAEPHYSLGSWKPLFLLEIRFLLVSWAFGSLLIATVKRRVEKEGENKRERVSHRSSQKGGCSMNPNQPATANHYVCVTKTILPSLWGTALTRKELEELNFYRTRVRSLVMLVSDWLTNSLLFSKLDWCDPGVWRWQLKTYWDCYCC